MFKSILKALLLLSVLVQANPSVADEFEDVEFTIATFNAEFLTRKRLHVRYGLPFFLNPGDDNREKVVASLLRGDDGDWPGFLQDYDDSESLRDHVHNWGDESFRDERLSQSINLVADHIANNIDADVLVLTEIGTANNEVNRLNERLAVSGNDYPHVAVCQCWDSFTNQGVAVLSKFPIEDPVFSLGGREGYLVELDDAVGESSTTLSKAMRVTLTIGHQRFFVFAAHLKSELGGYEADAKRIAQAALLRRHTLSMLGKCEIDSIFVDRDASGQCPVDARPAHVLVVGDLNDHRGQPALRRIRGFDDLYEDLEQSAKKKYVGEDNWGERWTKEHEGILNHIDHILISDSVFNINRELGTRGRVGVNTRFIPTTADISDHRPIMVTFAYKAKVNEIQ